MDFFMLLGEIPLARVFPESESHIHVVCLNVNSTLSLEKAVTVVGRIGLT